MVVAAEAVSGLLTGGRLLFAGWLAGGKPLFAGWLLVAAGCSSSRPQSLKP